jgi:hypothetical protein
MCFSKRYIICEGARESKNSIYKYLFDVNDSLNETFRNEDTNLDVESVVPISILLGNKEFFDYIYNSNERLVKISIYL